MRHLLAIAAVALLAGCAATPKGEALPQRGLGQEPPDEILAKPMIAARTGKVVRTKVLWISEGSRNWNLPLWNHGKGFRDFVWEIEGERGTVAVAADSAYGANGHWVLTDYRILTPAEAAVIEARAEEEPAHWAHTVLPRPVALKRDPTDEAPETLLKDRAVVEQAGTIKSVTPTASSIASESAEEPDFNQSTTYRIEGDKGVAYGEARAEKKKGRWWLIGYTIYPPKVVTKLEGLRAGGK